MRQPDNDIAAATAAPPHGPQVGQEIAPIPTRDGWVVALFTVYFTLVVLVLLAMSAMGEQVFNLGYWGSLDDRSAVLRNLGLVAVGVIGLPFGIWRAITAHRQAQTGNEQARILSRQAETANMQAETASRQADLAEKGLMIDRFQKGAAMLDSVELSVRLAGIYALRELAMSDPDETYIMVQDLLCDFIREGSKERQPDLTKISRAKPQPNYGPFPPDLQKALEALSGLRNKVPSAEIFEKKALWQVDLRGANLSKAHLYRARLSGASLADANLANAHLYGADLSKTHLQNANLFGAYLRFANLASAYLNSANLANANLIKANLASADLSNTNLSDVSFYRTKIDDKTALTKVWAFEGVLNQSLPEGLRSKISIRKTGEPWDDFIDRMIAERPEQGWMKWLRNFDADDFH